MTDGLDFLLGRQAYRGGALQLGVTGEMSLSYLLARAAKLSFVRWGGDRKRDDVRGGEGYETRLC